MEFRLLGPLEVRDGERIIEIGGGRRRALLALLLVHRNEVVPAERLIDELWDGTPPPSAAKGLQVHVSHLRKELAAAADGGPALLRTRSPGYVLEIGPRDLDSVRFEDAVNDAARARDDGRPGTAAAILREASSLWRGPPLVDFTYDAFAREEIARLEELHLVANEERIDAELALGHHHEALPELEHLVATHPLREHLRALLLLALYRSGRRADALAVYRDGRERSIDEIGIELGPELRALEHAILTDDSALAAPPRASAPPSTRVALVLLMAAALLGGAVGAAFLLEDRERPAFAQPAVDLSADAVAGLGRDGRPTFSVPLPGRPTEIAAYGEHLFAVTVDASALTVTDARTRRITHRVPLPIRPGAVAVDGGAVWIVDGRRGVAIRLDAGYERIAARATWRRMRPPPASGVLRLDPTGVAVAGGAAWITDGSPTMTRADAAGNVRRTRLPHGADGLAAGAGAIWAFSHRRAAVMRLDPRTGRVTDVVPLARPAAGSPAPTAIAADRASVWVLNGTIGTLSRIDARTRGVIATVRLRRELSPRDVEVADGIVWVACSDGSVIRVSERTGSVRETLTRGALAGSAVSGSRTWVATTASER